MIACLVLLGCFLLFALFMMFIRAMLVGDKFGHDQIEYELGRQLLQAEKGRLFDAAIKSINSNEVFSAKINQDKHIVRYKNGDVMSFDGIYVLKVDNDNR